MCIPVGLEFTIQPVCQGPMAEAELIILKRRGRGGRRRDGRTRFRVSRSWASLFLLPALSTYGEASSIQGRGLVDSWNRFSVFVFLLFMRFLYYRKREDLSWNCNIRKKLGGKRWEKLVDILKTLRALRFFIEGVVIFEDY